MATTKFKRMELVEQCVHVEAGEKPLGLLSMQAAEGSPLDSHGTLCCPKCLLAGAEAVIAALILAGTTEQAKPT